MCRSDREETASVNLFACCGAVVVAAVLMAGAFHVGVKKAQIGEGARCVEQAVARGWLDSVGRAR